MGKKNEEVVQARYGYTNIPEPSTPAQKQTKQEMDKSIECLRQVVYLSKTYHNTLFVLANNDGLYEIRMVIPKENIEEVKAIVKAHALDNS